jgi:hypothetical protein
MMGISHHLDATLSPYPRKFFTEIICARRIEVSDEISEQIRQNNQNALQQIWQQIDNDKELIQGTLDLLQGTIGLKFHRQLVLVPLDEIAVIFIDPTPAIRFVSDAIEVLDDITLTDAGVRSLKTLLPAVGAAPVDARAFGSIVLEWLARTWRERDTVFKFLSLFIPLELCIQSVNTEEEDVVDERRQSLRTLVKQQPPDVAERLVPFVEHLLRSHKPSLVTRFSTLAKAASLPTCDQDIEAFKAFNKIRNTLVHSGNKNVKLITTLQDQTTKRLEDLVEKYVAFTLFKNAYVYPSRWREQ